MTSSIRDDDINNNGNRSAINNHCHREENSIEVIRTSLEQSFQGPFSSPSPTAIHIHIHPSSETPRSHSHSYSYSITSTSRSISKHKSKKQNIWFAFWIPIIFIVMIVEIAWFLPWVHLEYHLLIPDVNNYNSNLHIMPFTLSSFPLELHLFQCLGGLCAEDINIIQDLQQIQSFEHHSNTSTPSFNYNNNDDDYDNDDTNNDTQPLQSSNHKSQQQDPIAMWFDTIADILSKITFYPKTLQNKRYDPQIAPLFRGSLLGILFFLGGGVCLLLSLVLHGIMCVRFYSKQNKISLPQPSSSNTHYVPNTQHLDNFHDSHDYNSQESQNNNFNINDENEGDDNNDGEHQMVVLPIVQFLNSIGSTLVMSCPVVYFSMTWRQVIQLQNGSYGLGSKVTLICCLLINLLEAFHGEVYLMFKMLILMKRQKNT